MVHSLLFNKINTGQLRLEDILSLQNYIDSVFRLIVLVYTLSIAVVAITNGHVLVWILASLLIIVSLLYALFTTYHVGKYLLTIPGYHPFNVWFYYTEVVFLIILYVVMVYYYYNRK
jgi:hypothetical protein